MSTLNLLIPYLHSHNGPGSSSVWNSSCESSQPMLCINVDKLTLEKALSHCHSAEVTKSAQGNQGSVNRKASFGSF